jgi:hypothetical protein
MTTILFLVIFITGTAWTLAVNKSIEHKEDVGRYWLFCVAMTCLTILLATWFGDLARNSSPPTSAQVNVTALLGGDAGE